MREVSGIVMKVQRTQLLVLNKGAVTLQHSLCLESLADLRGEHDIRIPWVSQPDLDLTGDKSSLGTDCDESSRCAMMSTVKIYGFLPEPTNFFPKLLEPTTTF
jgi:hypothetical protein